MIDTNSSEQWQRHYPYTLRVNAVSCEVIPYWGVKNLHSHIVLNEKVSVFDLLLEENI